MKARKDLWSLFIAFVVVVVVVFVPLRGEATTDRCNLNERTEIVFTFGRCVSEEIVEEEEDE